ncbi:uncharacterized protein LOC131218528 isoform X2 [Magnolia sinica]|uniref:uncharacterized protein LOC131218528 isoform X2 n=1 Tax=Magnolia sinica TaxID=86752 RepID=UPI00265A8358|nr:uncharacterized protein LOC131218528 isoform X2 [Magnolia sinica]
MPPSTESCLPKRGPFIKNENPRIKSSAPASSKSSPRLFLLLFFLFSDTCTPRNHTHPAQVSRNTENLLEKTGGRLESAGVVRMEHPYSGGNWMVMPNVPNQISSPSITNQDHSQHHHHHHHHHPQQQHHHHQQQQQQQPQQHQNNLHQSLASHFHLLHLAESLAEATENGTRDQHSDALTVEGQKHKLEESEQLLNQRRDLIAKYKSCVEELAKSDHSK